MKKFPLIFGLGALGGAAAYFGVIDYFYNIGFNARFKPVADDDGFFKGSEYEDELKAGMAWLREFNSEEVSVINDSGLKLVGHYFSCPDAKRTLIGFHGWRAKWFYDFAYMGRWFYENNCNLLLIEEQGQGKSEGKNMGFGLSEHLDVPVWVNWVLDNKNDKLPIYIMGRSMGAATVMMAAGKPLPEEVSGIIADCGFSSPYKMIRHFCINKARLPEHPFMDGVMPMIKLRTGLDIKSYSALEALRDATKPILFIHGEADGFVPCEMTHEDYKACASKKKLLIVPGADHCMSDVVAPEKYKSAVMEFFEEN